VMVSLDAAASIIVVDFTELAAMGQQTAAA
jgi:hypothetical protein